MTIETEDGDETKTDKTDVTATSEYSVGGGTYTDEFTIKRPKGAGTTQTRDLEAP